MPASGPLCVWLRNSPDKFWLDRARAGSDFVCRANRAPLPAVPLKISWRLGIDVKPIDQTNPEHVAWLEALVWPDEWNRFDLLRAAIEIARHDPPAVIRGDLRTDIRGLVAQMPEDATRVVSQYRSRLRDSARADSFYVDREGTRCGVD
ncbi:MAG: DUF2332 family protein [Deltaproteobacteria bacterium]|nr:DUF2332 family protein [Deltaproteobacteria bacterium]